MLPLRWGVPSSACCRDRPIRLACMPQGPLAIASSSHQHRLHYARLPAAPQERLTSRAWQPPPSSQLRLRVAVIRCRFGVSSFCRGLGGVAITQRSLHGIGGLLCELLLPILPSDSLRFHCPQCGGDPLRLRWRRRPRVSVRGRGVPCCRASNTCIRGGFRGIGNSEQDAAPNRHSAVLGDGGFYSWRSVGSTFSQRKGRRGSALLLIRSPSRPRRGAAS